MKVLVCLFAVLAVANAGLIANSGVYGSGLYSSGIYNSGLYSSGNYISAPATYVQSAPVVQSVRVVKQSVTPVTYVQSAPIVESVRVVKQPVYHQAVSTVYSAPAPIYHTAPVYQSAPIYQSTPAVSVPNVSQSYGINYGPRYASSYSIGAPNNVFSVVKGGFLKHK